MTPDHVIFLHIPKTAGTTLIKVLRNQYGRSSIFSIYSQPTSDDAERFVSLPQQVRDRYRLLQGHWPFGMHKFFSGECRYISAMRDPVDRLVSEYYYILRIPDHYLHEQVTSCNMSLEDFVTSDITTELDNGQLRLLAGCEKEVPFGQIGKEHLEMAKQNIEKHFDVVGLTKRFDETLLLYKHFLGWKRYPYYHRRNVTAARPSSDTATPESLSLIAERNRFECALYEWVKERFEEQINKYDGDFSAELAQFRSFNSLYQRWLPDVRKPKWMQKRLKRTSA